LASLANFEESNTSVACGTTRFRYALTLALLAAGGGETRATHLDKTACADLNTELSGLLASGLKEDMDKGPAWAAANLPLERVVAINKVIELQGQVEFRCSSPGRNLAKSPNPRPGDKTPADTPGTAKAATAKSNTDESGDDAAPATKPAPKKTMRRKRGSAATSPELPVVVPVATTPIIQPRATAPATPPAVVTPAKPLPVAPVATTPAEQPTRTTTAAAPPAAVTPADLVHEASKTAVSAPPKVAPANNPVRTVSTTPDSAQAKASVGTVPVAAAVATPASGAQAAPATGMEKGATPKPAAKKPSRRDSTSAYMSPADVNPFGLPTGN
jgi:hypothetical protein